MRTSGHSLQFSNLDLRRLTPTSTASTRSLFNMNHMHENMRNKINNSRRDIISVRNDGGTKKIGLNDKYQKMQV